MADNIHYRDAFVTCKVIEDVEGGRRLDLPFPIYHQTVTESNVCYYCHLPPSLVGKTVLAYIHYAIADDAKVKAYANFLGSSWSDASKDAKATAIWSVKKEDALATTTVVGEIETVNKYNGADKAEVVHPYIAEDTALKSK